MFSDIVTGLTHVKHVPDLDSGGANTITVNFTNSAGQQMNCNYVKINIGKNQAAGNSGFLVCKFLGYSKHGNLDPSGYIYSLTGGLPGVIIDVSKPFHYVLGFGKTITGVELHSNLANQNREIQVTYGVSLPVGGLKLKNLNPGL